MLAAERWWKSRARFGAGALVIVAVFVAVVSRPGPRFRTDHVENVAPSSSAQGPAPGGTATVSRPGPPSEPEVKLRFRPQNLPFQYERGETGNCWPVEPTGGGVGLLDYDGDGDLDIFFSQGMALAAGAGPQPSDVLLRNDGAGRFVDVSSAAGLTSKGYGQGVSVADYDGDGDSDVYVTRYGVNTLWRNDGGRFTDITSEAGVGCPLWSLGAAFGDYDGDGDLDLFVANYLTFDPATAPYERDPVTGAPAYGGRPTAFKPEPDVLYRNDGGRFTDVSARAGIEGDGRGMGVLAADLDGDGRVEFLVANDMGPNAVWRACGDGRMEDVAMAWGLALNARGQFEANMGIAGGDVNGDGLPDVLISHYFDEHHTLWCGQGVLGKHVFFLDLTYPAGLGAGSRPTTGWGTAFADFDQDGRLDLVVANGHIRPESRQRYRYENPPLLWWNAGGGRFANVTATGGPYFQELHQGRGLAVGDLDGDGGLDVVVVQHHAPSVVLWNETPSRGHWLLVDVRARGTNRDAVGARLTARVGGESIVRTIDNGGSYLSASDRRVYFGLGPAVRVDHLEVRWPSGRVDTRSDVPADRIIRWHEGDPEGSE